MTRYQELIQKRRGWFETNRYADYRNCPYVSEIEQIQVAALKTVETSVLKTMWDEWDCVSMFPVGEVLCDEWQIVDELQRRGVEIII
jgi:hypothetical protein